MKELEQNIFNVLIDTITLEEFENFIYQDFYVDQITSNKFVYNVISINYRNKNWKNELEELICQSWATPKYLSYSIRNYCLKLVETDKSDIIFDIIEKITELNRQFDYEYGTLMQFYQFNEELGLIQSGYGGYTIDKLIEIIKTYAEKYIDLYSLDTGFDLLLNLEEGFDKTYNSNEIVKTSKHTAISNILIKTKTRKKWFQFWRK
ncbi:hypothetical protein [uncultured Aquimarina sp.]|uniref:hypothetical protein n=1 Tax=uncultured Aquimarina sp. TaxID=575652 RepID=UPI00262878C3|nr:hypothetical protein [uncultured Aquimarina sp.]